MSNAVKARATLMRNLPKRGWNVVDGKGTYENLTIIFDESEWVMSQKEGGDVTEIDKGSYGKTQMVDVRAAASKAGVPFGPGTSEGKKTTPSGGSKEKKTNPDKKKAQAEANRKKTAKTAEKESGSESESNPDSESEAD